MPIPTTIIWDGSPQLFTKAFLNLRWYNLLFAAAVLGSIPIGYYMFEKAGKRKEEFENLKSYIIVGILLGARLGHVIFYDWTYYKNHLLEIFLPITFYPKFSITGFSGLASHGAAIGVLLAIYLYLTKLNFSLFPLRIYFKNSFSFGPFLWVLDQLVILIALGGSFIRIGNFMNSEIIGKPTGSNYGVVFVRALHDNLCKRYAAEIDHVTINKASIPNILPLKYNYQPIALTITFKSTMIDEKVIKNFLEQSLKKYLVQKAHFEESPNIYETYATSLSYTLGKKNGAYQAIVYTWGIPRHPSQLYESFSCFLIFILLFIWWYHKGQTLIPGRIAGTFALLVFSLRFFYEFYKENQVAFEDSMWLNMGQLLSLPCAIIGLFLILRPTPKVKEMS